jgi:sialate O-acetylesterase
MPPIRLLCVAVAACAAAAPLAAAPALALAPLFRDHAVLQRDKPVPVWGSAAPGEHVVVTFAGQSVGAKAGSDGRWIAVLAPLPANATGADLTVAGRSVATVHDILVGEVWLCSGGSGMEFPLGHSEGASREIAAARYPRIRQFKVEHQAAAVPAESARGEWSPCSPATAGQFTAIGYFFARELLARLDVPVGIIDSSWAGTPIESWMSPAALGAFPGYSNGHGTSPSAAGGDPWVPGSLFNGMIQPLLPYAFRGVVWSQGEANVGRAADYARQFPALIAAWRAHSGEGDFPFLWTQLPGVQVPVEAMGDGWARLREAQSAALSLPGTGQAVTMDIAGTGSPEVARRLALIAKADAYAIPVDFSGPAFSGASAEGGAIRVHFLFAGEGLTASGKPLQSFEVAGADRVFHPAVASIEGDTVVARSRAVRQPVAVRYAWRNATEANLFNGAGLPAPPFRSDSW